MIDFNREMETQINIFRVSHRLQRMPPGCPTMEVVDLFVLQPVH